MYQPYPTGAQMPEVQRPPIPPSAANAVKVMYAGAAASIVGIVIEIRQPHPQVSRRVFRGPPPV